jgi:hypothetical protein
MVGASSPPPSAAPPCCAAAPVRGCTARPHGSSVGSACQKPATAGPSHSSLGGASRRASDASRPASCAAVNSESLEARNVGWQVSRHSRTSHAPAQRATLPCGLRAAVSSDGLAATRRNGAKAITPGPSQAAATHASWPGGLQYMQLPGPASESHRPCKAARAASIHASVGRTRMAASAASKSAVAPAGSPGGRCTAALPLPAAAADTG